MPNGHYNEEEQICECEYDEQDQSTEDDYESMFGDDTRYYPGGPVDMDAATDKVLGDALERFIKWIWEQVSS
jgi:hypothetical protein